MISTLSEIWSNSFPVTINLYNQHYPLIISLRDMDLIQNPNYDVVGITKIRRYINNPTRFVLVFRGPRGGIFRLQPCGRRLYKISNFHQLNTN